MISTTAKLVLTGYQMKVALFELSKKCPFYCKYCYPRCGPTEKVVSLPVAEKIVASLTADKWLVRPYVAELVPDMKKFFPLFQKLNIKDINSAGDPLLNDPEWFDLIRKHHLETIRITVFPTDQLHADWTGRKRRNAIDAIQGALDRGFNVTWNFLLSRSTQSYLIGQIEQAYEIGVQEFNINNFFAMGRGSQLYSEMLNADELNRVKKEFYELRTRYDIDELLLTRTGMLGPNTLNPESSSAKLAALGKYCYAGSGAHGQLICIDVNQKVYGCMTHHDPELQIGTVSDEGLLQISEKTLMDNFHRKDCFTMHYLKQKSKQYQKRKE